MVEEVVERVESVMVVQMRLGWRTAYEHVSPATNGQVARCYFHLSPDSARAPRLTLKFFRQIVPLSLSLTLLNVRSISFRPFHVTLAFRVFPLPFPISPSLSSRPT